MEALTIHEALNDVRKLMPHGNFKQDRLYVAVPIYSYVRGCVVGESIRPVIGVEKTDCAALPDVQLLVGEDGEDEYFADSEDEPEYYI